MGTVARTFLHKFATSRNEPGKGMVEFCGLQRTGILWQKRPRRAASYRSYLITYWFYCGRGWWESNPRPLAWLSDIPAFRLNNKGAHWAHVHLRPFASAWVSAGCRAGWISGWNRGKLRPNSTHSVECVGADLNHRHKDIQSLILIHRAPPLRRESFARARQNCRPSSGPG
jgi:hypothetical protein